MLGSIDQHAIISGTAEQPPFRGVQSPEAEKIKLEIAALKKRIQQGEKAVQDLQKKGKERQSLVDKLSAEHARLAEGELGAPLVDMLAALHHGF